MMMVMITLMMIMGHGCIWGILRGGKDQQDREGKERILRDEEDESMPHIHI
jgi:nitrogen fixation-related uncharacterized protein